MLKGALKELLGDTAHPNEMPDAPLLRDYLRAGCRHGEPIVLSFGETWTEAPPRLRSLLADLPAHAHGYQFSMYGLPSLLSILQKRIAVEHRLEPQAFSTGALDLAVSWSGTRTAMFDFGRIVVERTESTRERVIVVMGPSWDYEGCSSHSASRCGTCISGRRTPLRRRWSGSMRRWPPFARTRSSSWRWS